MKIWKIVLRTVAFLLLLAFAIYAIPWKLFGADNPGSHARAKSFYKENRGSLDAVVLGASNVHQFWQPAIGWQKRGIAVCNLSFDSLPILSFRYLIAEARKTQPNALYIINLSTFKQKGAIDTIEKYHNVVDYMPLSVERVKFIQTISEKSGFSLGQQLELLFPFIRFHSRWNELESWSYGAREYQYKTSRVHQSFTHGVVDCSKKYKVYDSRTKPLSGASQVLNDLLDYLDREHVNALFIKVPQVIPKKKQGRLNALEDQLKARGYPCLDLMKEYEAYGLNPQRDFYNKNHTNIRGSLKLTEYMADYLAEQYHFADKRGQAEYADWDEAGRDYDRLIDSWILPFEREKNLWQDLPAPKINEAKAEGTGIRLTWSASRGADGYVIYRKTDEEDDGHWKLLATVGADALSYLDEALSANTRYTYCVAPFCDADGQKAYGNYKIGGASCTSPKKTGQSGGQEKSGGDGN